MNATSSEGPLADTLTRELQCLQALEQNLAQERAALLAQESAALEQAVTAKRNLLVQAQRLAAERTALLRSAGLPETGAGMTTLLERSGAAAELRETWAELLRLASVCRDQNRHNGSIVEQGLHHVQRTLNVLRGQPAEAPVYGRGGRTSNGAGSRTLARA